MKRNWAASDDSTMATVIGTTGRDFIHVAGDGRVVPPGFNDIALATIGDDDISGGDGDDKIYGDGGDDMIDGGVGADDMSGGSGNDSFIVDNVGDTAQGGVGIDTIYASVSFTLDKNNENMVLTGGAAITATGNSDANMLTGNGADNSLLGLDGDDLLIGGAGADHLDGGTGRDRASYASSAAGVRVDLLVVGAQSGGDARGDVLVHIQDLTGSSNNDVLRGDLLANDLDGGAGADVMRGRGGDDVYHVDNSGDEIAEVDGEGIDTVYASVSYTLSNYVETLYLLGAATDGTGSAQANSLYGNDLANRLDGKGGDDALYGGNGADVYVVDSTADQVIEAGTDGAIDTVIATASYSIAAAVLVENLQLIGQGLTAHGNGLANLMTADGKTSVLYGDDGNDTLRSLSGGVTLYGGAGDDKLYSDVGSDVMDGGDGVDTYYVSGKGTTISDTSSVYAIDTVYASANVTIGSGIEYLYLTGDQALTVTSSGVSEVHANDAGDTITGGYNVYGGAGNDRLIGDKGYNQLHGGGGDDRLEGGTNSDILEGGAGSDLLYGGAGSDTATYEHSIAGVTVDLMLVGAQVSGGEASGDTLVNIESVVGSAQADILSGTAGANQLTGGAGNDILSGRGGIDFLQGGDGDDLVELGNNRYFTGTNLPYQALRDFGYINGDAGFDTINYVDLSHGVAFGYTRIGKTSYFTDNDSNRINGFEAIIGTSFDDNIYGFAQVQAGDGNDAVTAIFSGTVMDGGAGDDNLIGYIGHDELIGGLGRDILTGGDGTDLFIFKTIADSAPDTPDTITDFNQNKDDRIDLTALDGNSALAGLQGFHFGGAAFTGVAGELIQSVVGGQTQLLGDVNGDGVADFVILFDGKPTLVDGDIDDSVEGTAGDDVLIGGPTNNSIYGYAGNDQLTGGQGSDTVSGGIGADTFIFRTTAGTPPGDGNHDIITDFSRAEGDRIDLSNIDANAGVGGNQSFTLVAGGAFTHSAGELIQFTDHGNTVVQGDINGDAIADFEILLSGAPLLTASDFML